VPQDKPARKMTGLVDQRALAGTQRKKDGLTLMEESKGDSIEIQGSR